MPLRALIGRVQVMIDCLRNRPYRPSRMCGMVSGGTLRRPRTAVPGTRSATSSAVNSLVLLGRGGSISDAVSGSSSSSGGPVFEGPKLYLRFSRSDSCFCWIFVHMASEVLLVEASLRELKCDGWVPRCGDVAQISDGPQRHSPGRLVAWLGAY